MWLVSLEMHSDRRARDSVGERTDPLCFRRREDERTRVSVPERAGPRGRSELLGAQIAMSEFAESLVRQVEGKRRVPASAQLEIASLEHVKAIRSLSSTESDAKGGPITDDEPRLRVLCQLVERILRYGQKGAYKKKKPVYPNRRLRF